MSFASQLSLALQSIGSEFKKRTFVNVPPSGWYAEPQGVLSAGPGTLFKGGLRIVPFQTGPISWISSGFILNVTSAFAGGVSGPLSVAIYGVLSDGSPDWVAGPLVRGAYDLSGSVGTGIKIQAWTSGNYTLKPGFYWIVTLYTNSTAPSSGQISCYTNVTYRLGSPTSTTPGTSIRSIISSLTTFTTFPTTAPALSVSGGSDTPALGILRA